VVSRTQQLTIEQTNERTKGNPMSQLYEAPTYKTYSNPDEQWLEWKRQANTLPIIELERHASVSRDNRHACTDCFCCACVELLGEKKALARKGWNQ
jgi:hypothetical protein